MRRMVARLTSWWNDVRRSSVVDAEMDEEFRNHIELRAADHERAGLPADEALRRARLEFGGVYDYSCQGREARGLAGFDWLRVSWLDFRLGVRTIGKYRGVTIMSVLAIGIAIAVGAGALGAIATVESPTLPLDQGDRIVGIQLYDIATRKPERRILGEFADWKGHLKSIGDVGAFRPTVMNLEGTEAANDPILGAEMSAAGFRAARVPPVLGRYLLDEDERPEAPNVVVLGYDVWTSRFHADSGIVGRQVRMGDTLRTIVGVMPRGFAFPVSYSMWIPLRAVPRDAARRTGPEVFVFGRLAPGATLQQARTELATRTATAPRVPSEAKRTLRATVLPFARSWFDVDDPSMAQAFWIAKLILLLLVVVICVNVATLVYARTATRQTEIAVRTALGASRGRIIAQLFGESCVLAAFGAAAGLALISIGTSQLQRALTQFGLTSIPFWVQFNVSPATLEYTVGLTLLGAVIIGVLPALQVTGPRVQLRLQQLAGGHSTVRVGKVWKTLIVAEVAFAVALLPAAVRFSADWVGVVRAGPGFPAEQYLSATLGMQPPSRAMAGPSLLSRFAVARDQLIAQLDQDPNVLGVTFADAVPGSEPTAPLESDMTAHADSIARAQARFGEPPQTRVSTVDGRYFQTLDIPLLEGRALGPSDAGSHATSILVNQSFAKLLFGDGRAVGHHVRLLTYDEHKITPGQWYEIVGVVRDFPASVPFPGIPHASMYRIASAGGLYPISLIVHVRSDPTRFAERLRRIASRVQPDLLLRRVGALDEQMRAQVLPLQWIAVSLAIVTLSVLMLSCAGVYALMSLLVTQRRREIGIRVALGAQGRQVLWALFSRAMAQVGTGAAIGIAVALLFDYAFTDNALLGSARAVILASVTGAVCFAAVLSALTPARTALRIPPTSALKAE